MLFMLNLNLKNKTMNSIKLVFFIYRTMEKNMHRYFSLNYIFHIIIYIIKYNMVYILKHFLILKQLLKIYLSK